MATHGALLAIRDLAAHPWLTVATLAVAFAALYGCRRVRRLRPATILGVAVALRALLVPLPPTLSDDVLRYMWDGKVLTNGSNPYALAPDAPELAALRDEAWERMPHREVEAVYPPLAMALFSIATLAAWPLLAWKLLLTAIEMAGCWLFVRWMDRRGEPPGRALLYAWNPLVTLEVAGMGHVDGVGVALMIAVVTLLDRRPIVAGIAAAGAVLAKLVPLLALPLWWQRAREGRRFALPATALLLAGLVPVVASTGVPPGWVRFGVSWEFNGPLFEPLWRGLDAAGAEEGLHHLFDRAKQWTGAHEFWNRFYPWVYPQLLAKGALGLLLAVLWWRIWRRRSLTPPVATGRVFGALILCSATVYPWYLLWVLPWAAAAGHRGWLALSGLAVLSYLPQHAGLELMPWVFAAIWGPFAWLSWSGRRWSSR